MRLRTLLQAANNRLAVRTQNSSAGSDYHVIDLVVGPRRVWHAPVDTNSKQLLIATTAYGARQAN